MAVKVDELAADAILRRLLRARLQRTIRIANPGAATEISFTAPGGTYLELVALSALLTTDATVGNRVPQLVIRDADTIAQAAISPGAQQAASLAQRWTWLEGVGCVVTGVAPLAPLPEEALLLLPGWSFITSSTLLGADAWSAVGLTVIDWTPDRIAQVSSKLENDVAGMLGDAPSDDFQF